MDIKFALIIYWAAWFLAVQYCVTAKKLDDLHNALWKDGP